MTTPPFTVLEVGKPYSLTRLLWDEGSDYNYRSEQHELHLFLESPNQREIKDIIKGPTRFALAVEGDIIFLCYKFGDLPWSDSTYNYHLVPADQQTLPPETTPTEHAVLTVVLIDAATGIVRGLRLVTFSPSFTLALHTAIRQQAARPFPGIDAYDAHIARIYSAYDSAGIADTLAAITCQGGQQ